MCLPEEGRNARIFMAAELTGFQAKTSPWEHSIALTSLEPAGDCLSLSVFSRAVLLVCVCVCVET